MKCNEHAPQAVARVGGRQIQRVALRRLLRALHVVDDRAAREILGADSRRAREREQQGNQRARGNESFHRFGPFRERAHADSSQRIVAPAVHFLQQPRDDILVQRRLGPRPPGRMPSQRNRPHRPLVSRPRNSFTLTTPPAMPIGVMPKSRCSMRTPNKSRPSPV